jgi:excisionase family DNA binding protein
MKASKVKEVGEALRVRPETIRRRLLAGDIRGVRIGRGSKSEWRIPASELERFTGEGG